ncbi:hypothetical protein B0T12DRAFT_479964 [Alternaria alternata]|nr:hypothetical protein B0T12DRAFT_479964 [Alternaria alternata]
MTTQRPLATSAVECERLFDILSSQLLDKERETRTSLSQPSIEDEGARYRTWAGNLGAFQRLPATSSLDYRLMESPKVASQIQELLEDLRHALQRILAIASGESPNRVAELTDSEDDPKDDHDEEEPEKVSDGSEDGVAENLIIEVDADETPNHLYEAGELLKSIKDTITGLFRIAIVIRKASPRDRFAKALATRQEPFDGRSDIGHVSEKFPMLNIKEKEWFKERVGKAMTQRRQYLRYVRDHRDKLAKEPKDLWQPEDIGPVTTLLPVLSQASKTNFTNSTSTLATTTASTLLVEKLATKEEDFHDNQSQTSYAVSLGEDDDESHLRLLRLADVSKHATTFECPLCWTIQDIQSDSTWRKHVFRDLKPYICTFEVCDIKLFSDRREWFEHELLHHRAQWCCDFCGKGDFRSLKIFKDHVRSRHMQSIKDDQLDALSKASRRSIDRIPASDCPFCQEWEVKLRLANPDISADEIVVVTPIQFRHHVGSHMQQLALFSVPRGFLEDDADNKSVTSLDKAQSDTAGLRKAKMTLEFGSLEDALKELQKLHEQNPNDLEVHLLLSKCYHEIGNESAALVHSVRAQVLRALTRREDRSDELSDSGTEASIESEVQVIETHKENLGAGHTDALTSVSNLVTMLSRQGKYKEAEAILLRALEDYEKAWGPEHTLTLSTVGNLGAFYKDLSRLQEGEEMFKRALAGYEKAWGPDHTSTLDTVNNLGNLYTDLGKLEQAEKMYERAFRGYEKVFGREHPDTLTSMANLASTYRNQGRWDEAEKLEVQVIETSGHYGNALQATSLGGHEAVVRLEHVVEVYGKTLAAEHPDRLASQHALAMAYKADGQVHKAVGLLEQVVEIKEKTLAETHPDRLASQHALAGAYRTNGQTKEAVGLLEHVVKVQETTLAETHPDRLASQHALAGAYRTNGQTKEAVGLLEHVVKVHKTTLAEAHPDRLASQHELASAYYANGQTKEAVGLLEHVVKVQETTLAETHPDRLASQHALAGAYRTNGQTKEAVELLEHVVKVHKTTMPATHPSRQVSERVLAYLQSRVES